MADPFPWTELVIVLLLIVLNGFFAMSELAIVSARRVRLQVQADEGDKSAALAIRLAEEPTRFLSTVQVGITLFGTFAAVFGGAGVTEQLQVILERVPALAPYAFVTGLICPACRGSGCAGDSTGALALGAGYPCRQPSGPHPPWPLATQSEPGSQLGTTASGGR